MENEQKFNVSIEYLDILQDKGLGEEKKWKGIRKKLQQCKELDKNDIEYFQNCAKEYSESLTKNREHTIELIENLQKQGIGEDVKWEKIKQILKDGNNLEGMDLEYFYAKHKEFERGVVTTTFNVDGKQIVSYLGIVSGQTVIGLMFLKDEIMKLTDFFGGRSGILERNFRTAKENAIKQMTEEARKLGANAVVGTSIHFNPIEGKGKQMLMVIATGTAVITRANT